MRQVTIAGLKAHKARLVAVSIAVALATAFMSATFLLSASSNATLKATLGNEYQNADLILPAFSGGESSLMLTEATVNDLKSLTGVREAAGIKTQGATLKANSKRVPYSLVSVPLPEGLDNTTLIEGGMPEGPGELVLDQVTSKLLQVSLGDIVDFEVDITETPQSHQLKLVGVMEASKNPFMGGTGEALITDEAFNEYFTFEAPETFRFSQILIQLAPGASTASLEEQLSSLTFIDAENNQVEAPVITTPDEQVAETVASFTDGNNVLTAVLLAFVGIALFVAGLVIANTYSVLVAQRSRELALLRLVGASSKQVRRSVLAESAVMGFVASALGVAIAFALMRGIIWFADRLDLANGIGKFGYNWQAIVLPLITGVLVTVIAASGPAREATRVAPLEALRAKSSDTVTKSAGRVRLTFGALTSTAGALIIALGFKNETPDVVLLIALFGSAITAVGVLMLMVFIVPKVTHFVGNLLFARSVPGALAALNSKRNPRRTAVTASALLIGVTLVSTVYTGAEVAKATLNAELDRAFPVDLAVEVFSEEEVIDTEMREAIESLAGVQAVALAESTWVESPDTDIFSAWALPPSQFALVSNDKNATLRVGEALVGNETDATEVRFSNDAGSVKLKVTKLGAPRSIAVMTPEDFANIATSTGPHVALIKITPGLTSGELLQLREELANTVPNSYVMGEGIERAMFESIITILLLIVTGLLAVAIIIAIIGIGNTLSLSVIERTRENALLRALGLTRGQLRWMLAAEALLTALVAAVIGTVLGVIYGFVGALAVLQGMTDVRLGVPWFAVIVILSVATLAGLISSVLPARRAVKLPPVEGLRAV